VQLCAKSSRFFDLVHHICGIQRNNIISSSAEHTLVSLRSVVDIVVQYGIQHSMCKEAILYPVQQNAHC
jgi:hypothetical protein